MKADVTVHIVDTVTGQRHLYRYSAHFEPDQSFGENEYAWWTTGNAGCDCNRGIFAGVWGMRDFTVSASARCSEGRFLVEKIIRDDTGRVVYSENVRAKA